MVKERNKNPIIKTKGAFKINSEKALLTHKIRIINNIQKETASNFIIKICSLKDTNLLLLRDVKIRTIKTKNKFFVLMKIRFYILI